MRSKKARDSGHGLFHIINAIAALLQPRMKLALSLALAAALVVFAILFALDWNTPSHETPSGSLLASSGTDKDLLVRGFLDKNRLYSSETLRLHLIFENHSTAPLHIGIRDLQTPGFARLAIPQPFDLAAGASHPIDLDLSPSEAGRFKVAVLYQLTRSSGGSEESFLSLGPVEIRTALGSLIEHSIAPVHQIYAVVKDFTLPVVLAVLAYLFQQHQSSRDQQAAEDREVRETRQQIWSSQIPRFRIYAEKHYLPIVSNIRHLRKDYDSFAASTPAQQDGEAGIKLLYRMLLLLRRMVYLREEEGGVFFQVRRAELIVQQAWWSLNSHIEDQFHVDRRDRALALLAPDEPYHHFLEIAADEPVFEELRVVTIAWARSGGHLSQCLELAHVMLAVFGFEANRPFDEYWYGSPDEFEGKAIGDYAFPAEPKERIEKLKIEYEAYKKEVDDYCSKWPLR